MARGYDKSQQEETDVEKSYQSPEVIVHDITEALLKKGYKLVPTVKGKHANHNIYVKSRVPENQNIHYWKRPTTEIEWTGFTSTLENVIYNLGSVNGSDYLSIARKLQVNLLQQATDKKTVLAGIGYSNAFCKDPKADRSFSGQLAFKQIPRLSWFPELKDLSPFELLALFPQAEAKAFMLMLGRTMCGVGGSISTEGTIAHRMRAAAIVVGVDPGLGKSTLLTGLIAAMKLLGYHAEPIVDGAARFGWGEVAESDLAFRDDLNRQSQTALLKSDKLKTIITGGALSTERKGIDSDTTDSKATLICCSNEYNVYDFYQMDEGSISRFNFLYTYNREELAEKYNFDARGVENITRLCKKYNVKENRLYTYLLAHSVEYFLEVLGYEVTDQQLLQTGEDTLQTVMADLRKEYIYAPAITHVKDLVTSSAHLLALAIGSFRKKSVRDNVVSKLEPIGFDYTLLYEVIRHYSMSGTTEPWDLVGIESGCKRAVKKRLEDLNNKQGNRNALDAFVLLTSELLSVDGATFPKAPGNYVRLWAEAKKKIPALVEHYAQEYDYDEVQNCTNKSVAAIIDLVREEEK